MKKRFSEILSHQITLLKKKLQKNNFIISERQLKTYGNY